MIRLSTIEDAEAIHRLASFFCGESGYGMEYDRNATQAYFELILANPDRAAIYLDDSLNGGILLVVSQDWCKRPVCYVEKLFLMPEARGTSIARALIDKAVEFAEAHACSHVFASATANMGPVVEKMFINLFRKFGFEPCGAFVCRGL